MACIFVEQRRKAGSASQALCVQFRHPIISSTSKHAKLNAELNTVQGLVG